MGRFKKFNFAHTQGYKSGLEDKIAIELEECGCKVNYETIKIEWEDLAYRTYTPDFILTNGIIIESKGLFTVADRRKHLVIKKQHPNLDVRFVFQNCSKKIRKGSKTTYSDWCDKYNIPCAEKVIPVKWINEKKKRKLPLTFNKFPFKKLIRRYKNDKR